MLSICFEADIIFTQLYILDNNNGLLYLKLIVWTLCKVFLP